MSAVHRRPGHPDQADAIGAGHRRSLGAADGKVAVDFRFDGVQPFSEELAAVQIGEKWGFIDRRGTLVIAAEFEDGSTLEPRGPRVGPPIWTFSEGLTAVYKGGIRTS